MQGRALHPYKESHCVIAELTCTVQIGITVCLSILLTLNSVAFTNALHWYVMNFLRNGNSFHSLWIIAEAWLFFKFFTVSKPFRKVTAMSVYGGMEIKFNIFYMLMSDLTLRPSLATIPIVQKVRRATDTRQGDERRSDQGPFWESNFHGSACNVTLVIESV
jgi:hypothetical protein